MKTNSSCEHLTCQESSHSFLSFNGTWKYCKHIIILQDTLFGFQEYTDHAEVLHFPSALYQMGLIILGQNGFLFYFHY